MRDKGQQIGELSKKLVAPPGRGNEQYTQWVNSLKRPIAMIRDSNMKQIVFACIRHLKVNTKQIVFVCIRHLKVSTKQIGFACIRHFKVPG